MCLQNSVQVTLGAMCGDGLWLYANIKIEISIGAKILIRFMV